MTEGVLLGSRATGSAQDDRPAYARLGTVAHEALADASSAAAWPAAARARALAELDRVGDLIAAARGRLLTAERDAGTWAGRGDRDLAGWRGRTSRTGVGEAAAQVREAETLEAMPQVERALTGGQVRAGHVGVLARAAARAPEQVAAVMRSAAGQAELVGLAARTDTRDFARVVERWLAQQDPATVQRAHDNQRARRFLHLSDSPGGTHVKGLLDSFSGRVVRLALEAASPRPGADDERSPEQRRADALVMLAEGLLTGPTTTPGAMVRPHVSVILREETWAALRRARAGAGHSGEPAAGAADAGPAGTSAAQSDSAEAAGLLTEALAGVPAPCDEDGNPLPASEVARILCDGELTRIVVDAVGTPVDLGRTARLHSPAQRRAITHRDGGCVWAGCAVPARWCEVHHPRWWTRDHGGTSVDNGVLLCSFHHHEVHRRDITVTRGAGAGPAPPQATARANAEYVLTLPDGTVVADGALVAEGTLVAERDLAADRTPLVERDPVADRIPVADRTPATSATREPDRTPSTQRRGPRPPSTSPLPPQGLAGRGEPARPPPR